MNCITSTIGNMKRTARGLAAGEKREFFRPEIKEIKDVKFSQCTVSGHRKNYAPELRARTDEYIAEMITITQAYMKLTEAGDWQHVCATTNGLQEEGAWSTVLKQAQAYAIVNGNLAADLQALNENNWAEDVVVLARLYAAIAQDDKTRSQDPVTIRRLIKGEVKALTTPALQARRQAASR